MASASFSLYPKSSMLLVPLAMQSNAAATTAASTQPPDTEPMVSASSRTAIEVPAGRGTEPDTSATVATAHRWGSARQAAYSRILSSTKDTSVTGGWCTSSGHPPRER